MKIDKIFQQKNKFIFDKVCKKDYDEFSKLFHIKNGKTSFEHRKIYLKANWLGKATSPRNFRKEYEKYPFSEILYNGKKLFKNAEEFLNIDLVVFEEKVKLYVEYKNTITIPRNLNYKYLYTFSSNGVEGNHNIDYYHIKHLSNIDNEIEIEVAPPKNKESLNIKPYIGTLKLEKNRLILNFSNSDDYVSAIFNIGLANRHTKYLVGVGIGIADNNEKIPMSKKTVLTKELIKDIEELYPTLNETERISAKENSYKLEVDNNNILPNHLEKYIKKVERLNILFKKLIKQGYFTSFYEKLALQEFSATNTLFQKFQKKHSFYVHYRKRVLDILIESHNTNPYNKLCMVMPIYKDDNLFEQQSDNAITLQNKLKELSKNVTIEIIFVLKSCDKVFKQEFMNLLKEMNSTMTIKFAFKEKIAYEVNSVDFFFTDRDDFIISKSLRTNITAFQLYQHKNTIDEYHAYYRKIFNRSMSYKEFISNKNKICKTINPLIKTLSGDWYHYIYGTKNLWEDKITIFEDGRVEYYCDGHQTEEGEIIVKEYQSVILLDEPITKRLFTIIFDNQPYKIQKALFTKSIAKQFETDRDIFSIGIMSRKLIAIEKVLDILGDVDDVRFLEKNIMSEKLSDYLMDSFGYPHNQKD